jgi:hypothetical protein
VPVRRSSPFAALLAVLLVALALSAVAGHARPAVAAAPPQDPPPALPALRSDLAAPFRMAAAGLAGALRAQRAQDAARERARRRAEAARLRATRTVRGAIRRAWLLGAIDRAHHDRYRRSWRDSLALARQLPAGRRAELEGVLRNVAGLAAGRALTPSRLRPAFLVVERNAAFWRGGRLPAPGAPISFGDDPVVFRYVPGQGLAVHPLASWGRVNGLAAACVAKPRRCPRVRLRRALDQMSGLASRRGGFVAWEYLHRYGRGAAPWISGMAQGTAVQALARGAAALHDRRYLATARRALGAFEQAPPLGVAVPAAGGTHYLMYSFDPSMRILNGFLQAVTGLRDLSVLSGSRRARTLYREGERAARAAVRHYDTGAWSLYSGGGAESTLGYHQLVEGFLSNLCRRTHRGVYCSAGRRFARYEREPPRIDVVRPRRLRAGREASIAFALSKVATVSVRVDGRPLAAGLQLPRGRHALPWLPRARGRHRIEVAAVALSGPRGLASELVRVKPRRVRRHRPAPAHRADGPAARRPRRGQTRPRAAGSR